MTLVAASHAPVTPAPRLSRSDLGRALSRPILVEEGVAFGFIRAALMLVSLGVMALIVWAGFARVHEVSRASGEIVPEGLERVVQHLEGGIVQNVLVRPGDIVDEGQPLFVLDDATTNEDLSVLSRQQQGLMVQAEVLKALLAGIRPDFTPLAITDLSIIETGRSSYTSMSDAQQSRRDVLRAGITQSAADLSALASQMTGLETERGFAADAVNRAEQLLAKGAISQTATDERRNVLSRIESQIAVLEQTRQSAEADVTEARRALTAFEAETRSDLTARLQQVETNLAAFDGEMAKAGRRQNRLVVSSPVKGVVKFVAVTTLGGVVTPGAEMARIVPSDEALYVEAQLPADQIGYVSTGLDAKLKISAFDFTRFGWVEGTVEHISPSAFRSADGRAYFQLRIKLDTTSPGFAPGAQVVPGMQVSADIITGETTVLNSLLHPIRKAFATAFSER